MTTSEDKTAPEAASASLAADPGVAAASALAAPARRARGPVRTGDPYVDRVKPDMGPLMQAMGLLVTYHRGEGDYLYYSADEGEEVEVLDLAGGFGANLFGHSHPELREQVRAVLDDRTPFLVQGSRRQDAAALVERLAPLLEEACGHDYVFVFSSSGSEAVNLALQHAHLEYLQRSPGQPAEPAALVTLEGGFHGVSARAVERRGYPGPETLRVPPGNVEALQDVFDRERRGQGSRIMAMIVETIQGEGGVRVLDERYLQAARKLCRRDGVPLVVDEVQTGMGRTGRLLDGLSSGVVGDYVVLSKALGGGLTKIGLTLIDRGRWVPEFDWHSLSTFAEDPFSCRVAGAVVELLTRDDGAVLEQIRARGEEFRQLLEQVRAEHPSVIREVRGRGLMIGVELAPQDQNPSRALCTLSSSDLLGNLLASYFLHNESIRVLPTVSAPRVLRIQPSYAIRHREMDRFADALRLACRAIEGGDCGFLARHLLGVRRDDLRFEAPRSYPLDVRIAQLPDGIPKVAFLGHFILPDHVSLWDASFERFDTAEKEAFFDRFARHLEPRVTSSTVIESRAGERVGYVFIGMPQTSVIYAQALRRKRHGWLLGKIHRALDVARSEGCSVVGFGGFTSIVTDNLRGIDAPDLVLTTGNAFTVAAGVDAIVEGAADAGIDLGAATLGVAGALGNIASVYTLLMTPRVEHLILIGRPTTRRRLERFRTERLPPRLRERVSVSTSMESLKECDLVLAATNSPRATIFPEHLDPEREVLICDISIPGDCSPELHDLPHCHVIQGGLVHPEGNDGISFPGVPLADGEMFACMAETALLGLEGITENFSHGSLGVEEVERIRTIARRHGFRFLGPKLERSF